MQEEEWKNWTLPSHCNGLPCPTNITTPGQERHVPQTNNKPAILQKHVIRNPDNQHDDNDDDDDDDDDKDLFVNLCIPPIQTR